MVRKPRGGDTKTALLTAVTSNALGADMLVLGMVGRKGPKEDPTLLGQNADFCLRQSSIPLMIVKRSDELPRPCTFVVAVDGSEAADSGVSLAVHLARDGDTVQIVHVGNASVTTTAATTTTTTQLTSPAAGGGSAAAALPPAGVERGQSARALSPLAGAASQQHPAPVPSEPGTPRFASSSVAGRYAAMVAQANTNSSSGGEGPTLSFVQLPSSPKASVAATLISHAADMGAQFIVIGVDGLSAQAHGKQRRLGSTSDDVVRSAKTNVICAQPRGGSY